MTLLGTGLGPVPSSYSQVGGFLCLRSRNPTEFPVSFSVTVILGDLEFGLVTTVPRSVGGKGRRHTLPCVSTGTRAEERYLQIRRELVNV